MGRWPRSVPRSCMTAGHTAPPRGMPTPPRTPTGARPRILPVMPDPIILTGRDLTLEAVEAVARHGAPAILAPEARRRMAQSRAVIEAIVARDETVYGVTTGFGDLATKRISPADAARLQENLLVSHAVGVGPRLALAPVGGLLLRAGRPPAPAPRGEGGPGAPQRDADDDRGRRSRRPRRRAAGAHRQRRGRHEHRGPARHGRGLLGRLPRHPPPPPPGARRRRAAA